MAILPPPPMMAHFLTTAERTSYRTTAVYSTNHTMHINLLCGQRADRLHVQVVKIVAIVF